MKVIFSHGKESGPWGSKIKYLANTANALGFEIDSIDYSGMLDPDERAKKLSAYIKSEKAPYILVGSSMGGYVSLVTAQKTSPLGTFLLAPALYISDYSQQEYANNIDRLEIVHGWSDDIIPVENSIKYAQQAKCTLHLIDGDHRLNSSLEQVNELFALFLTQFLKVKS
ncbi:alpha/beta hydrolase [Glaciecola sp. MF2-115]|uniref:alpha/beta hydrolase n=1 Tax=Glaciecola sp. MF2-115 TaxID=3384827 RepID=UPI0039A03D55